MTYGFDFLTGDHYVLAHHLIRNPGRDGIRQPDVVLMPDGDPYLYRWWLIPPDNAHGNVFFHIQVKSDPERPLHDHPWDNQSVILVGGYNEIYDRHPDDPHRIDDGERKLRQGDVVARRATEAHRLILPADIPYTMTLFTTGPKIREWGFWYPDGFHNNKRHVRDREDGTSTHAHEETAHV